MRVSIKGWAISTPFNSLDEVHHTPHKGIDFAIPSGTQIPSVGDGVVSSVINEGTKSFGKSVWVHMKDGTDVIYGHLSQFNVQHGQTVHTGDIVGLSGNSGDSTGPHFHLQIMKNGSPIDPSSYLQAPQKDIPWWDLKDQAIAAGEAFKEWLKQQFIDLGYSLLHGVESFLDVALPTLAIVGILWWMVPVFPKSDKGMKLTGTSLIIYLFYILIRSGYQ